MPDAWQTKVYKQAVPRYSTPRIKPYCAEGRLETPGKVRLVNAEGDTPDEALRELRIRIKGGA